MTLTNSSGCLQPLTIATLLASAVATVALDQGSKVLVTSLLTEGQRIALVSGSGLRRVTNVQASLLPLSGRGALLVWLAVVACLALIIIALGSPLTRAGAIGLGLVLGGATGNLADRIARGGVVDMIALGRWPTFNLADAAMAAGAALAVWSFL